MKNLVLIPKEAALDRVISALSVVPQLVPNTKRGWFGGKSQSKHMQTFDCGDTRLDLYQVRPYGKVTVTGNVVATFTYLEIHKDLINWGAVYEKLHGDNVTRTGQKFRVKLPSGYYVVVEPLAKYRAGVSLHGRGDSRAKMRRNLDRTIGQSAIAEMSGKFSAGEMQRIAHDIEAHREETFTEVAEEMTDAQELAIAEQAMAEKQDVVVVDSMSQLVEQERTFEGAVEGLEHVGVTIGDLTPTPHKLAELADQSVGFERGTVGGLGTCPCDDSALGDQ